MHVALPPHVIAALSETSAASVTAVLLPAYRVGDAVVLMPTNRVEEEMLIQGPRWEDVTGYSRGGDRTPRTWELRLPDLHIIVTRHINHPGTWLLMCDAAGFARRDLLTDDVDAARLHALRLVRDRLAKIADYARNAFEWESARHASVDAAAEVKP